MNSYFYLQVQKTSENATIIEELENYSNMHKSLIYVLERPLVEQENVYNDKYKGLIILSPKNKIVFVDYNNNADKFEEFVEDTIEDIGYISKKYLYTSIIGRPREWKDNLIEMRKINDVERNIKHLFMSCKLTNPQDVKNIDLLISLFIGSINDIDRVKKEIPQTDLDKIKQKIQLFDGDQTRFIYHQAEDKKNIRIQGLSGTGKTELLLHKLKDIYVNNGDSKIFFTCHNKILADNLRKRIPSFFNFMKVEQQIEWEQRLWCAHAWGSSAYPNSGFYSYICSFYEITHFSYSFSMSFSRVCQLAIEEIKEKQRQEEKKYAFSHMIIDESQDFDEYFFDLCNLVTKEKVYIAGDIFQSIFDERVSASIKPDFLLGKCYRTDPKTLMFAHGLGMGLFEEDKLRWLEKDEWEACGYNVEIENKRYVLSREPLRRFEDLKDNYKSIEIIELDQNISKFSEKVVKIIKDIKIENSTVQPDDIAIILLDADKGIYELANFLERDIYEELNWEVNKAYQTKKRIPNMVLISNRNNVKGLEFPFVICITKEIKNSHTYRNSLYTMLTRSFIKSFLLTPPNQLTDGMKQGLNEIIATQKMVIKEPSPQEKQKIRTSFETKKHKLPLYDTVKNIFSELNIDEKHLKRMLMMIETMGLAEKDEENLKNFIENNSKYLN